MRTQSKLSLHHVYRVLAECKNDVNVKLDE